MSEKAIHDLAVAYAQAKLIKESDQKGFTSEEIQSFLKAYHFALIHIPEEDKEILLDKLC